MKGYRRFNDHRAQFWSGIKRTSFNIPRRIALGIFHYVLRNGAFLSRAVLVSRSILEKAGKTKQEN